MRYDIITLSHYHIMGWLRSVGSMKLQVSFAEYRLFYSALLQKRPVILRSLLNRSHPISHCHIIMLSCYWRHWNTRRAVGTSDAGHRLHACVCVCVCVSVYTYIYTYLHIFICTLTHTCIAEGSGRRRCRIPFTCCWINSKARSSYLLAVMLTSRRLPICSFRSLAVRVCVCVILDSFDASNDVNSDIAAYLNMYVYICIYMYIHIYIRITNTSTKHSIFILGLLFQEKITNLFSVSHFFLIYWIFSCKNS